MRKAHTAVLYEKDTAKVVEALEELTDYLDEIHGAMLGPKTNDVKETQGQ